MKNALKVPVTPRGSRALRRIARYVLTIVAILLVEYLVVPQLVGATRDLDLLHRIDVAWVIGGTLLEGASLVSYSMLTRALLPAKSATIPRLMTILLSTAAVAHVLPGGAAGGAGLGFRLLEAAGVAPTEAAFVLVAEALLSALVLNALVWVALIVSIPFAGLHPLYVLTALMGMVLMLGACLAAYTLTRGEQWAIRWVRAIGARLPRVGPDRLEGIIRDLGDAVTTLGGDRRVLARASVWAALNWLLDAGSLWMFLAAFGHLLNPWEMFAAYGIANVVGALPIVPGGLGVVEATAISLLASFGTPQAAATLGVLGWRLVNFWLPIPLGAASYGWLVLRHATHPQPATSVEG